MAAEGTVGAAVASGREGLFFQSAQRLHDHLLTIRAGGLLPLSSSGLVQTLTRVGDDGSSGYEPVGNSISGERNV